METATIDDYRALNDQLAALVEAGVPLDAGFPSTGGSATAVLERINVAVARRMRRGESLAEALEGDDQEVPAAYRSLVQLGLHSDRNLAAGFDGASRMASAADRTRNALEAALVYPLVVCVMVYAGMISLCLFFVPTLEGMYASLALPPGPGLRVLQVIRDAMPFWAVILPILLAGILAWRMRLRSRRRATGVASGGMAAWLPGVSTSMYQQRCARFADALAGLVDDGVPLNEALRTAADATGDGQLRASVARLTTAVESGQLPSSDSPTAELFPPFLRWAIWNSEDTTGRTRALEIAARVYRQAAERRGEQFRTIAPMVATVLLGGTVTLLYGLALFVPLVELLRTLAK